MEYGQIIDTRQLIERQAELEADDERDEYDDEELAEINALADEITDWQYGETLIRSDYFEEYARELAEDIGAINPDAAWPACHIDWSAAADALKMDYSEFQLAGHDYYARS